MFCPKCGSQNPDGAAFCGGCGAPFSANQQAAASPVATPAPFAAQPAPAAGGTVALAAHKTGRTLGIVIAAVVVVVLVIIAIATGGFGLFGSKVSFDPKSSVEAYSWSELSELSAAIAKEKDEKGAIELAKKYHLVNSDGKLDGTQTKTVTLSGGKSVQVQIAGFNHDDKTEGGKAGITFIFRGAINKYAMNSNATNSGGWKDSKMRSWLANEGMNMLPDDLRSKIVAVDKKTNNTGQTQSDSSVTTTSDKLWLFSDVELLGEVAKSELSYDYEYAAAVFNAEGAKYKLFSDCETSWSAPSNILIREYDSSTCYWWLRSPYIMSSSSSKDFNEITSSGGRSYDSASRSDGVVPGFCI